MFDLRILDNFIKRIAHVKIPLICGIWPLVSYRNAEFMNNEVPGASVPAEIQERMRKTTTRSRKSQQLMTRIKKRRRKGLESRQRTTTRTATRISPRI